jgi:hypothetical protein
MSDRTSGLADTAKSSHRPTAVPKTQAPADPTTRRPTRYRGITYRDRRDGTRAYSVYFKGRYHRVDGGENEAVAKQADLRGRAARGEQPITVNRLTFAEVTEQWFQSKRHLRPWTRKSYRSALDSVLLPAFGARRIGAIDTEDVAGLIHDLERRGLSHSTIENYLLPLSGTLAFAVRRGLIPTNPCSRLTRDDRPRRTERRQDHVWNDEEIESLIDACKQLAKQPAARYDYTPLIRTSVFRTATWRATWSSVA